MATLQKIRNRGPLLVAVIGLALFAFVAGDAWKAIQPHQGRQDIGEVNGETISAQDYQALVDEYTEVIKMTQGTSALNDDQLTQVKDQVWQSYINNKLIETEAEKLGLKGPSLWLRKAASASSSVPSPLRTRLLWLPVSRVIRLVSLLPLPT